MKNKSGITHILPLVLFGLAIVLVPIVFLAWNNQNVIQKYEIGNQVKENLQQEDKTGWEMYTNSAYGFQFEYPARFAQKDNLGDYVDFSQQAPAEAQLIDENTIVPNTDKPADNIVVGTVSLTDQTFEEYIESEKQIYGEGGYMGETGPENAEEIEMAGQNAVIMQTWTSSWMLYIPSPDNNYVLVMSITTWSEEFENELNDHIFSSIEFID